MSPNTSAPVAGPPPHVRDRVDPNGVTEHTVREHEREAAHDATPYAELWADVRERRAGRRERGNQLHCAFDGCVEALATARPLQLVPIGGGIQLGACGRHELDDFHDRFLSRAWPSANTVSAGMPGAFSPIRRSISAAHAAATATSSSSGLLRGCERRQAGLLVPRQRPRSATGVATGTYVLGGGTGRFASASGTADFEAAPSADEPGAFELTAVGTVCY